MDNRTEMNDVLSWTLSDPEQRIGFAGGRFTRVNHLLAGLLGALLTAAVFGVLFPFRSTPVGMLFFRENSLPITVSIVFLTAWSLAILALKLAKLRLQRRALRLSIMPDGHDFVLSPNTVDQVVERMATCVDDPRNFVLLNRIDWALSNLRNLGRVGDVSEMFTTQAEYDEGNMETSYLAVAAFVWAIPVLGFIGTVLGLSQAIGEFGGVLQSSSELDQIKQQLQQVTGGLSTAFETTLLGLVAALIVQLCMASLKKSEHEFLDDCSEYCSRHVISRLRLLPLETAGER